MILNYVNLKQMDYDKAHQVQLSVLKAVQEGLLPDTLLLVEHPPVITMGRNAESANVLFSEDFLAQEGIALRTIERGGDATYHGPGQLVGYPIFDLKARHGRSIRTFVHRLESVFIDYLKDCHYLEAHRSDVNAGVWLGDSKITAIGLAVKRGVTFHGFAFNVNTNLSHYQYIVPCGLVGKGVTSLEQLLGHTLEMDTVKAAIALAVQKHYGFEGLIEMSLERLMEVLSSVHISEEGLDVES